VSLYTQGRSSLISFRNGPGDQLPYPDPLNVPAADTGSMLYQKYLAGKGSGGAERERRGGKEGCGREGKEARRCEGATRSERGA